MKIRFGKLDRNIKDNIFVWYCTKARNGDFSIMGNFSKKEIVDVRDYLRKKFPSMYLNEHRDTYVVAHFYFKDVADEAYFLLWSSDGFEKGDGIEI